MLISARADELGDNQGEFDAQVEGPETKIAFSSKYLQEVLTVTPSTKLDLEGLDTFASLKVGMKVHVKVEPVTGALQSHQPGIGSAQY